jgi:drug/metabolite transporter (DMT)-like permease
MIPIVVVLVAWLLWKAPERLRRLDRRIPQLRAAMIGLAIVGVLGFALNDTGIAVPAVMLAVANSVLIALVASIPADEHKPAGERERVSIPA